MTLAAMVIVVVGGVYRRCCLRRVHLGGEEGWRRDCATQKRLGIPRRTRLDG
jgi:hypothetical protein